MFYWGWVIGYGKVMVDVAVPLSGDGYGKVAKAWWGVLGKETGRV